jgi:hypothetical protein
VLSHALQGSSWQVLQTDNQRTKAHRTSSPAGTSLDLANKNSRGWKQRQRVQEDLSKLLDNLRTVSLADVLFSPAVVAILIGSSCFKPREALILRFEPLTCWPKANRQVNPGIVEVGPGRTSCGPALCHVSLGNFDHASHRTDSADSKRDLLKRCSLEMVKATAALPELSFNRSTKLFVVIPSGGCAGFATDSSLHLPGFSPTNLKCTVTHAHFSVQMSKPVGSSSGACPDASPAARPPSQTGHQLEAWTLLQRPLRAWQLAQHG